ncbi:MAG: hypothetical protein WDZ57_00505 [Demequina sp.]
MRMFRNPAFMAAVAITAIVALYFTLVAGRAVAFVRADEAAAKALGIALLVLPAIGVWYLIHEWRLGTTTQRMADVLDAQGRLPIHDGETKPSGRLTEESANAVFEVAQRGVEDNPDDWAAWFHVAYAYEASGDRSMARKSLRHAGDLFRAERRAARQR